MEPNRSFTLKIIPIVVTILSLQIHHEHQDYTVNISPPTCRYFEKEKKCIRFHEENERIADFRTQKGTSV